MPNDQTTMTTAQDLLDAMDGIALLTDADLTITAVGRRNWTRMWEAQAPGTPVADPLGRCLTDAMTEGVVRNTFRLLFQQVLSGEHGTVRLDYRCDLPQRHRLMRLTLTPVGSGADRQLLYQSVLLSEAPRPPVPLIDRSYLLTGPAEPSSTRLCPMCFRVWVPGLAKDHLDWTEPPAGGRDLAVPEVVHEFCPSCHSRFFEPG